MTEPPEEQPIPDIRTWLSARVQILAWELNRQMANLVRDYFGLTMPEWRIIANLAAHDGVSVQTLAQLTGMDKAQVSRTVTSLALSNTIAREADPSDGRAVLLHLTDKGNALFAQIEPVSTARRDWLSTLADNDDIETFSRVADILIDGLRNAPDLKPIGRTKDGTA